MHITAMKIGEVCYAELHITWIYTTPPQARIKDSPIQPQPPPPIQHPARDLEDWREIV